MFANYTMIVGENTSEKQKNMYSLDQLNIKKLAWQ